MIWFTALFAVLLAWSGYRPADRFTWWLEILPALLGYVAIAGCWRRWRFTNLTLAVILAHMAVLLVGGHYTYAEVPGFRFDIGWLGGSRNDFDKVGHFMQGFGPALIAREILVRRDVVRSRGWLSFFIVSICLAISAGYELLEWWVSVATGSSGDAFLGTQGYVWDTQSDMLCALIGAVVALAGFSRWQDRAVRALAPAQPRGGPPAR